MNTYDPTLPLHDVLPISEEALQPVQGLTPHRAEGGAERVHGRVDDRAQDPVGHVGRTGNLQEVPAALNRHGMLLSVRPRIIAVRQEGANGKRPWAGGEGPDRSGKPSEYQS